MNEEDKKKLKYRGLNAHEYKEMKQEEEGKNRSQGNFGQQLSPNAKLSRKRLPVSTWKDVYQSDYEREKYL